MGCNPVVVGVGGLQSSCGRVGGLQSSCGRGGWVAIQLW